ncbi:MAG TPA: ester cyclase [Candidatus Krumholzibacteria bacterium]|nr:ester cyclase [Candidatus Krumholzibacteria bacterium]
MDSNDHRALISRIAHDIWNRGDLAVVDEVMSPNGKYHGPHMPGGVGDRDTWRRAIGMYRSAFPDSCVTFDDMVVCENTVVGRWSATATHTGQLPGVAPTGRRITIGGITIYRIEAGKIMEAWEQLDMLGMWQQIGVVSLPGHA